MTLRQLIQALQVELSERGDTGEVWYADDGDIIHRVRGVGRFGDGTVHLSYEELD